MPSAQFENEAMNCGERKVSKTRTDRFAMIGVDLYQASPDDLEHVNDPATGDYELIIVDVSDPTNPHVRSRVSATTSTHTVTLHRRHRLPLRLLRGRRLRGRRAGQLLDLRPHRPGRPGRGRQRPGHARHPAVPLRRRRLGRPQVERRRRGLRHAHRRGRVVHLRRPRPAAPPRGRQHRRRRRLGARGLGQPLQRLHPPQQPPPQREGVPARRAAVAGQRQRPARHRGGLRGPRLLDRRLVPDLARQAPRRLRRVDRPARQGRARRPRHLPGPGRRLLLLALVRLPPERHRGGRLLRRRHPADRRHRPDGADEPRFRLVGRLGGLGLDVGARLQPQGHRDRPEHQPRLLDRPGARPRRVRRRRAGRRHRDDPVRRGRHQPAAVVPGVLVGGSAAVALLLHRRAGAASCSRPDQPRRSTASSPSCEDLGARWADVGEADVEHRHGPPDAYDEHATPVGEAVLEPADQHPGRLVTHARRQPGPVLEDDVAALAVVGGDVADAVLAELPVALDQRPRPGLRGEPDEVLVDQRHRPAAHAGGDAAEDPAAAAHHLSRSSQPRGAKTGERSTMRSGSRMSG